MFTLSGDLGQRSYLNIQEKPISEGGEKMKNEMFLYRVSYMYIFIVFMIPHLRQDVSCVAASLTAHSLLYWTPSEDILSKDTNPHSCSYLLAFCVTHFPLLSPLSPTL